MSENVTNYINAIIRIQNNKDQTKCPICGSPEIIDEGCCTNCWETNILPFK